MLVSSQSAGECSAPMSIFKSMRQTKEQRNEKLVQESILTRRGLSRLSSPASVRTANGSHPRAPASWRGVRLFAFKGLGGLVRVLQYRLSRRNSTSELSASVCTWRLKRSYAPRISSCLWPSALLWFPSPHVGRVRPATSHTVAP